MHGIRKTTSIYNMVLKFFEYCITLFLSVIRKLRCMRQLVQAELTW